MIHRLYPLAFLSLTILALTASAQESAETKPEKSRPSFVLILADDLGYADLGCYGGTIATPNIDALAKKGVRLTDFHTSGVVCSPTRAAMLTGLYPHRLGIQGVLTATQHRDTGLDPSAVTIAERLKELGYATALFGKWHLGFAPEFGPNIQGFDEFRGFVGGDVDYRSHIDPVGEADWWHDGELEADEGYATDLITGYGLEFIERRGDQPFFLFLSHIAPHSPYQGRSDPAFREEGDFISGNGPRGDSKAAYAEMITALDEGVGKIVAALEARKLFENTYLVFCSDNGPTQLGDQGPWRGRKGKVWEGGHRVPAIVRGPGITAGESSDALVTGMDLAPTMLALAGGESRGVTFDGVDLTGFLLRGEPCPPRDLYWSHGAWQALRRGRWKVMLLEAPLGKEPKPVLYDLEADPGERKDVAAEHPELALELLRDLLALQAELTRGVKQRS